jgi:hypothetical protein
MTTPLARVSHGALIAAALAFGVGALASPACAQPAGNDSTTNIQRENTQGPNLSVVNDIKIGNRSQFQHRKNPS